MYTLTEQPRPDALHPLTFPFEEQINTPFIRYKGGADVFLYYEKGPITVARFNFGKIHWLAYRQTHFRNVLGVQEVLRSVKKHHLEHDLDEVIRLGATQHNSRDEHGPFGLWKYEPSRTEERREPPQQDFLRRALAYLGAR